MDLGGGGELYLGRGFQGTLTLYKAHSHLLEHYVGHAGLLIVYISCLNYSTSGSLQLSINNIVLSCY